MAAPLRLFNSVTRSVEPFVAKAAAGQVLWYDCGPTVYDSAHAGHARTYVCLDIIRRVVSSAMRLPVFYVMGVTDVDDKILNRSSEQGVTPTQLARQFEGEFWEDMDRLGVAPPAVATRVSDHIPAIVSYIQAMEDNGFTYTHDTGVYFDTRAFEAAGHSYGKLDRRRAEGNVGADDEPPTDSFKHDPRDFALWKSGSDTAVGAGGGWDSPWGPGRPGWHIECSAMIESVVGRGGVDVHGGGIDLLFPHHTNEVAQADAHHGNPSDCSSCASLAGSFVHTGHLYIQGRKMSKSLKNFVTIRELLSQHSADQFRLFCLQYSYRSNVTYSDDRMQEAGRVLTRLTSLGGVLTGLSRADTPSQWGDAERSLYAQLQSATATVDSALLNDVDTPTVVQTLLDVVAATHKYCGATPQPQPFAVAAVDGFVKQTLASVGMSSDVTAGRVGTADGASGTLPQLVDAVTSLRGDVRAAALETLKSADGGGDGKRLAKALLARCDVTRDELRAAGVAVADK